MIRLVRHNKNSELERLLACNIIQNRYDLLFGEDEYELYEQDGLGIPVRETGDHHGANIGLYLTKISERQLSELTSHLFETHPHWSYLDLKQTYTELPCVSPAPYCHIDLPEQIADFDAALSKKTRYNTKWYPKKIRKELGDYTIERLPVKELRDDELHCYLQWKELSHNFRLQNSERSYIKEYGITDYYRMLLNGKLVAIGFICQTGDNVYFENFSYDSAYHLYSVGMVLYYHIIQDLIRNKMRHFYLGWGGLEYKRRYNGTLSPCYSGRLFRNQQQFNHALHDRLPCVAKWSSKFHLPVQFMLRMYIHLFCPKPFRRPLRMHLQELLAAAKHNAG
ncbi:MAG: GNAT family N-acetyltransferase [Akkermansia sp.]